MGITVLESLGATVLGAFFAGLWHGLAKIGEAGLEDLAVGFDLLVAAAVAECTFLAEAHGTYLLARAGAIVLILVILPVMAFITKWHGFEEGTVYEREDLPRSDPKRYQAFHRMKNRAVLVTDLVGATVLCVLWWLNVEIGQVVSDWKRWLP